MADVEHYRSLLRKVVADRPWIVAQDVLVASGQHAEVLHGLGAERVFCLGGSRGTGEGPDPTRFPQVELGIRGTTIMGGIRAAEAAFADLPAQVRKRLDAFDPARRARVLAGFFSTAESIAGRPVYGARPPSWRALEDKTTIDALWKRCGVEHTASRVVEARIETLRRAARALDHGLGTIWVGDNREGFHGAAEYLRWVRNEEEARDAAEFLAAHCGRARVMPFLDGIPCSIHAVVFPETVIALRPCEMVVFRVPGSSRLAYAGSATFWDPDPSDREEMRRGARAVGRHLAASVGYRGAFTMDGVLTRGGFRPTELNPRYGAALTVLASGLPALPLYLIHLALAAGEELDWHPAALEEFVLRAADLHRRGGCVQVLARPVEESRHLAVVEERGAWRPAREDEAADAELSLGPSPVGGFLRVVLAPERTPIGASVAPRVAGALRFASETWNLDLPPLQPAPDLRPGGRT